MAKWAWEQLKKKVIVGVVVTVGVAIKATRIIKVAIKAIIIREEEAIKKIKGRYRIKRL